MRTVLFVVHSLKSPQFKLKFLLFIIDICWPPKLTSGYYNFMSAGVNHLFPEHDLQLPWSGTFKNSRGPSEAATPGSLAHPGGPCTRLTSILSMIQTICLPLWGLGVPWGCFSLSSLQQQFSFKTEEITGINNMGAESIWGVAGCFVMQTAELQNNRFSFSQCHCCSALHFCTVRSSLVVLGNI